MESSFTKRTLFLPEAFDAEEDFIIPGVRLTFGVVSDELLRFR